MVVRTPRRSTFLTCNLADHSTRHPLIPHLLSPPAEAELVAFALVASGCLVSLRHYGAPLRLGGIGIGIPGPAPPGGIGPIGPIPGSPIAPGGGPPAPSAASSAGSGAAAAGFFGGAFSFFFVLFGAGFFAISIVPPFVRPLAVSRARSADQFRGPIRISRLTPPTTPCRIAGWLRRAPA